MPGRQYAKRVDTNHGDIRDSLRLLGFQVQDTSRLGAGFPDLVVYHPAHMEYGIKLIEIKVKGEKLTEPEQEFKGKWESYVIVAYSLDDVLTEFGMI